MISHQKIDEHVWNAVRVGLIGEIYCDIRAIVISLVDKNMKIIYCLDRPPTEYDYESIDIVASNIEASLPLGFLTVMEVECLHWTRSLNEMEQLGSVAYARREYDD